VPAGTEYRKYGPTPDDAYPHWYQIPLGDDDGGWIIAIISTDRGIGDDDDLTANGVIVDDGGSRNDRFIGHFISTQPPVNTYRI